MNEQDWEEFKKKVVPLEKKNNLLKKSKEKITLKTKEHKEKFETEFFTVKMKEKNSSKRIP